MHIELDDQLVSQIDALTGSRGRSKFVREAIERALDRKRRSDLIESALGSISDQGHEWDDDPAEWVRRQRRADPRRGG
jgi:Arc/MetJ-type ribon-helix-helix transcriptional regulator